MAGRYAGSNPSPSRPSGPWAPGCGCGPSCVGWRTKVPAGLVPVCYQLIVCLFAWLSILHRTQCARRDLMIELKGLRAGRAPAANSCGCFPLVFSLLFTSEWCAAASLVWPERRGRAAMPGKISNDLQASRSRGGVVACSGRGIDDLHTPATWRLGSDMAPRLAPRCGHDYAPQVPACARGRNDGSPSPGDGVM